MFERILVPTDFSSRSDTALRYGQAIAERFGASLHLLHVLEEPLLTGALGTEIFLPDAQAVHEQIRSNAERMLEERMPPDLRRRRRATTDIVVGPCAEAVVTFADDRGMSLIVVGTHAHGSVAHMLVGSVAETIVRKASCPVLTVLTPPESSASAKPFAQDVSSRA